MKKDKERTRDRKFVVQFSGLSMGRHEFDFQVDDSFFEQFSNSEISKGDFTVRLELLKQSTMLVLDFDIRGSVNVECDRCSEAFDLHVEGQSRLIVKIGNEDFEEESDIIVIPSTESEIDVSHSIYEYIILSLPQRRVHPVDKKGRSGCDPETIKKLEKVLLKEEKKRTDPRWDKLKKLKFK
ncbi:MAG: DUF177 domain-containing protein [Bacteroidota bacterium]